MLGKCELKGCRKPGLLKFYGHVVCEDHWAAYSRDEIDLKQLLNISEKCSAPLCQGKATKELQIGDTKFHLCDAHHKVLVDGGYVTSSEVTK
jgi:hypothetical protein